jgi:hypothetical protein
MQKKCNHSVAIFFHLQYPKYSSYIKSVAKCFLLWDGVFQLTREHRNTCNLMIRWEIIYNTTGQLCPQFPASLTRLILKNQPRSQVWCPL